MAPILLAYWIMKLYPGKKKRIFVFVFIFHLFSDRVRKLVRKLCQSERFGCQVYFDKVFDESMAIGGV